MKSTLILGFICLFGCKASTDNNTEELKGKIIEIDLAMSEMATKDGFNNSILFYADENIVKLSEGSLPIIGKTAFEASYDKSRDTKAISWYPVNADVAKSGELGYTWGNWKFVANDTILYGNYFTLWKKDADQNWKVVLDGGNSTPKPTN